MKIEPFAAICKDNNLTQNESLLKLKEKLVQSELDIQNGMIYSVEEIAAAMHKEVAVVGEATK